MKRSSNLDYKKQLCLLNKQTVSLQLISIYSVKCFISQIRYILNVLNHSSPRIRYHAIYNSNIYFHFCFVFLLQIFLTSNLIKTEISKRGIFASWLHCFCSATTFFFVPLHFTFRTYIQHFSLKIYTYKAQDGQIYISRDIMIYSFFFPVYFSMA